MASETKNTTKVQQNDEVKLLQDDKEQTQPLINSIYEQSIKLASTNIGQFAIRKMDKLLWVVENTAKWSVPQLYNEGDGNSEKPLPPPPLVRPLPWIFFIPALIAMRFLRAGLTFALLMLGKDSLQPSTIVHFIQIRRRKLRAIKYQGLKAIRTRNAQQQNQSTNVTLVGRISGAFNKLMCTSNTVTDDAVRVVVGKKNKSSIGVQQTSSTTSSSKRRHDAADTEEDDETKMKFCELLEKYVNEESDADSNFEIDEESESGSSSSTSNEPSDTEDAIDKKNEVKPSQNGNPKDMENGNVTNEQQHLNGHHNHAEMVNANGTPPGFVAENHVSPKKGSPTPEHHENHTQLDQQSQGNEQQHNDHSYYDHQNHNENNPETKYYHSRHIHNRNHNHQNHHQQHHHHHQYNYGNPHKFNNSRVRPQYNLGAHQQQQQHQSNGPIVPNKINNMNDDMPSVTAATSTTNQTDDKPKTTTQSQSRYNHNQRKSYHKKSSKNKH